VWKLWNCKRYLKSVKYTTESPHQEEPNKKSHSNWMKKIQVPYKSVMFGPFGPLQLEICRDASVGSEVVHLLQFLVTSIFEVSQKQKHRRRDVFYGRLTSKFFSLQNVIIDLSNQSWGSCRGFLTIRGRRGQTSHFYMVPEFFSSSLNRIFYLVLLDEGFQLYI
jgi:hypothetical protein